MNDSNRASLTKIVAEISRIIDSSDARIHKIKEKIIVIDAAIKESIRVLEKVDKDLEKMEVGLKEVLGVGNRIGEAGSGNHSTVGAGDGVQLNVEAEVAEKDKDMTPELKEGNTDVKGGAIISGVIGLGDGSCPVGAGDGEPDLEPKEVAGLDDVADGGFRSTLVGSEDGRNAVGVGDGVASSLEKEEEDLTPEVKDGSADAVGDESGPPIGVGDDVRLDMPPQEEEEEADGAAGGVSERTPLIRIDTGRLKYTKCWCYTLGDNPWLMIALFIFGAIVSGVIGLGDESCPVGAGDVVQPDLTTKEVAGHDDVADGGFRSTLAGSEGGSNVAGVGDGVVSSLEKEEEDLTPEVKDGSAGAIGDESGPPIRVVDDVRLDIPPQEKEADGAAGGVSEHTPLIRSDTRRLKYTKWRCYTLGDNLWMTIALFIFGAIFSFIFPYFLTANRVTWLSWGAAAAVSFLILSFTGLNCRKHHILRDTPTLFMRFMYVVLSSALTISVGELLQTSQDYYSGFTLIGLALFCLVEIAQPTCDYGILQLFVCLPLQIAIHLHGFTFHWSYIPGAIIPLVCLISQLYFVQYFDEMHREKKAKP